MRIRIKPHKRCEKCGHLVLSCLTQCPYCNCAPEEIIPKNAQPVVAQKEAVRKTVVRRAQTPPSVNKVKRASNKSIYKIIFAAAGVAALVVAAILLFKPAQFERSIMETMDADYVVKTNQELSGFADMYNKINRYRKSFDSNADYAEITYKRLYDYYHGFYNNTDTTEEIRQTAITEHDEKYRKPQMQKIQNVLNLWDDYVREHDINNYLQVNIITDYLVQEDYYDRYYRPKFYFDLSYPSGEYAIKDCFATFTIDYDNISDWVDLKLMKANDSPQHFYYLRGVDNSSFWDYHSVTVDIFNITLRDGTKIYANDINNVPENVRRYQDHKTLENEERLIKEFVNPDYVTQSEYVKNKLDEKLQAKDSLCFSFVREIML